MAKQDIKLTVGTEYKGEGLKKLDQGLKNSAKQAKQATDGVQKVTAALGTLDGKAGQVASKIGGLMQSFAQGGVWGLAIAGITAAFSLVIDKIKQIKEEGEKAASLVGSKMKAAFDKLFDNKQKIQLDIISQGKNSEAQRNVQDRISQIRQKGELDREEAKAEQEYRQKRRNMVEKNATDEALREFDQEYSKQKELRKVNSEEKNAEAEVRNLGERNKDYKKSEKAYGYLIYWNELRKNEIEKQAKNVRDGILNIDLLQDEKTRLEKAYRGYLGMDNEKATVVADEIERLGKKIEQATGNLRAALRSLEPYVDQQHIQNFRKSRESNVVERWTGKETFLNQVEQVISQYASKTQEYTKQQQEIKNQIAINEETSKQLQANLRSGLYSGKRKAIEDKYSADETLQTNRTNAEQAKKEKEEIDKKNAEIAKLVQEEEKKHLEIMRKLNEALANEKDALEKTLIVKNSNGDSDEQKWKLQDYAMEQIKKARKKLTDDRDMGKITDEEYTVENKILDAKRDKLKAEREILKSLLQEKKAAAGDEIKLQELDAEIKRLQKGIAEYREEMAKPIVQEAQNNNFTDWKNIQVRKQKDADRKAEKQNNNMVQAINRAQQLWNRTHDRNGNVLKSANQRDLEELAQLQQYNNANAKVDKLTEGEQRQLEQLQAMNPRALSPWHQQRLAALEEKDKNARDLQKKQADLEKAQKDRDAFAELRDIKKLDYLKDIKIQLGNLGL